MSTPSVITIDQQDRSISSYIFDAELGVLLDYIDVIDDDIDDHFSASRIYLPVELGPVPR